MFLKTGRGACGVHMVRMGSVWCRGETDLLPTLLRILARLRASEIAAPQQMIVDRPDGDATADVCSVVKRPLAVAASTRVEAVSRMEHQSNTCRNKLART